jgi:hypothetical protein
MSIRTHPPRKNQTSAVLGERLRSRYCNFMAMSSGVRKKTHPGSPHCRACFCGAITCPPAARRRLTAYPPPSPRSIRTAGLKRYQPGDATDLDTAILMGAPKRTAFMLAAGSAVGGRCRGLLRERPLHVRPSPTPQRARNRHEPA